MHTNQPSTTPPIWRRMAEIGRKLGDGWHSVTRGGGLESEPVGTEPAALGEAEVVEDDGEFRIHRVGAPVASRFEFFLDGIEEIRLCGYLGTVPIVHGYVAAVVRRRAGRTFVTWEDAREEEVLAVPDALLGRRTLIDLGFPAERVLDSGADPSVPHPIRLAEAGRAAVKRHRERLEAELARRWVDTVKRDHGWMLVDGGLAIDPGLAGSGRAAGVVKSHRTQFLPPDAMHRVLAMDAGARSSVFRPLRPAVGAVYSWYLRLRPAAGHDIYWGLIRVEAAADEGTLERADEVSRWLLNETAPLALPDHRWHVLLYPIRDCEAYLRARMPTLGVG